MAKKYDLVATTGSYEKDGQTKYINKNVGRVMEWEGKQYIVMDPSFNPAGCLRQKDGSVRIAMFEPRDNNQGQQQGGYGGQAQSTQEPFDDGADIPF